MWKGKTVSRGSDRFMLTLERSSNSSSLYTRPKILRRLYVIRVHNRLRSMAQRKRWMRRPSGIRVLHSLHPITLNANSLITVYMFAFVMGTLFFLSCLMVISRILPRAYDTADIPYRLVLPTSSVLALTLPSVSSARASSHGPILP